MYFYHSGYNKLPDIQGELNIPKNQLYQNDPKRWNSVYHLLERVNEQRRAIFVYFLETHLNFENLSISPWEIVQQLITLLKLFEKVTKMN